MANARLRPRIWPIRPPVIISDAITSVYIVIAVWMPVTVVPRSLATVAMDTFITDESRIITNCADASVRRTSLAAALGPAVVPVDSATVSVRSRCGGVDVAGPLNVHRVPFAAATRPQGVRRSRRACGGVSLPWAAAPGRESAASRRDGSHVGIQVSTDS